MNADKLKGKMKEMGITYNQGAKALNLSVTSFSNKVNNKNKFTVMEAQILSNFLQMTNEEKVAIFLD